MPGQPDRIHFGGDRCCQHEDCLDFPGRLNIACVHVIDLEKSTKVHVQWLGCHGVSSLWRDGGEAFTLGVLSRSRIVMFLMSIDVFDQDSFIADLVVGLRTGRTSANVDPKNRTKAQSVLSPECLRTIARAPLNLRTLLRESKTPTILWWERHGILSRTCAPLWQDPINSAALRPRAVWGTKCCVKNTRHWRQCVSAAPTYWIFHTASAELQKACDSGGTVCRLIQESCGSGRACSSCFVRCNIHVLPVTTPLLPPFFGEMVSYEPHRFRSD